MRRKSPCNALCFHAGTRSLLLRPSSEHIEMSSLFTNYYGIYGQVKANWQFGIFLGEKQSPRTKLW